MDKQPPKPVGAPPGRWVSGEYLRQFISRSQLGAFQQHHTADLYWLPDTRAETLNRQILD